MDVADATGERIGKVTDIRLGDPDAIDIRSHDPGLPSDRYAALLGADSEPNVPAGLADRMLRIGYIKIDDKRHLRRDHHYYATAEEIVSVEANTVHLSKACDELTTPGG
jgi:hypothetical protein